ncbi:hypothetical protein CHS0354_015034 [Potamilus streckersoni]|uniref:Fibronectin type-III domain-containing protein n=1 Tax=Potamilus streckersoni TaxID=2493646 RepID=A0AAE0THQ6_9BIVA|nr:hypothetical protein CHS0354_015034 [Potamilus streckersoni]
MHSCVIATVLKVLLLIRNLSSSVKRRDLETTNPFKPRVTFVPTGTQNIKLRIVIVHGQATGYEIMAVSKTSGSTYTVNGTFLTNETTSVYHFTTTDLPGTCFSFRVLVTSGSGHWAGHSEPVIEPNVCYGKIYSISFYHLS